MENSTPQILTCKLNVARASRRLIARYTRVYRISYSIDMLSLSAGCGTLLDWSNPRDSYVGPGKHTYAHVPLLATPDRVTKTHKRRSGPQARRP